MRGLVPFSMLLAMLVASGPAGAAGGRAGGKLLLTNGVSTIEGSSGGGVTTWSLIAGNETADGTGASAHVTAIVLADYDWHSHGVAIGIRDRLELSFARQNLNTRSVGARLGIGRGYTLNQDVYGAKLKLVGDAVYGSPYVPQVAIGVQHKRNLDPLIVAAIGARSASGTDVYVAATKLLLRQSLIVGATARLTKANQNGLLGFGSDGARKKTVQVESSIAYQLSPRLVIGAEYRSKPDKLGFAKEGDWQTGFVAVAVTRNLTATAAYVDLGAIATAKRQRGAFFSLQAAI